MLKRKKYDYDLIVIGSGAGGSVGAHYAASLGKKVAVFEKDYIGGECPNFACVPTKALLYAADIYENCKNSAFFGTMVDHTKLAYAKVHAWKNLVVERTGVSHGEESFKHDNITIFKEKAVFVSPHEIEANGKRYSAAKFLIATGSKVFIPKIEGLEEAGYITFKEAVNLKKPPQSIFILGGGAVACELSQIFAIFGSNVTLAIRSDSLLNKEDKEVRNLVKALFEYRGINILTNTAVEKVETKNDKKIIHYNQNDKKHSLSTEEILIATGKTPVLDFAPERAGLRIVNQQIQHNQYLQTNIPHIYLAGDVAGPYLFTHTGYYQSYIAVFNMFHRKRKKQDLRVIPRCVFITPEVASVGITEEEAKIKKIKFKKGLAPIAVLGRANTSNQFNGFVKIITDHKEHIIGASIVSPSAGEMIHILALAITLHAKAETLANMIVAYPTFSEAIKLACNTIE